MIRTSNLQILLFKHKLRNKATTHSIHNANQLKETAYNRFYNLTCKIILRFKLASCVIKYLLNVRDR